MNEPRALLIEDEVDLADIVREMLEISGFKSNSIDVVTTTREGLQLLENNSYQLVITDLSHTPPGTEVYKVAQTKGIDAYILTAALDPQLLAEARKLAGDRLLLKPEDLTRIQDLATQTIRKYQQPQTYKPPQPQS